MYISKIVKFTFSNAVVFFSLNVSVFNLFLICKIQFLRQERKRERKKERKKEGRKKERKKERKKDAARANV